ncbi:fibrobacter succinogenes major paralogous domain-containing protein [Pedobacter cryoconitis]|uniref:Fibronectin type-III domain-containing protein n=1 Tax=Pedobacter cryoconitis TaxID=188932 RepID=A0A327T6R2_9SPHI|nr:hypothetical protein [Pedobacter cryoconitis]RAJ33497.1 hypothetical protein LY11_01546 [Pedobacter cryoconitis]
MNKLLQHIVKLIYFFLLVGISNVSAQGYFRVIGGIPHLPVLAPSAVPAPAMGMLIYSSIDKQPLIYNGSTWETFCSSNLNTTTVKDYLEVKTGIPYLSALTAEPAGTNATGGVYFSKIENTMKVYDGITWWSVAKLYGKGDFTQNTGFSTNSGMKISKLPVLSSNPAPLGLSPGAIYINSQSKAIRYYTGSVWNDISCLPVISTLIPAKITNISALSGTNIINNGGSAITTYGICWDTSANPEITLSSKTENPVFGNDTGIFPGVMSGLKANTVYHVRAYAINSAGLVYGEDLTFTSALASLPDIITLDIDNFSPVMANSGGDIRSDGGAPVTKRGIIWSKTADPANDPNAITTLDGSGVGIFPSRLIDLLRNTTYYVMAYAVNVIGTAYGNLLQFTTPRATAPVLSSPNIKITDITDKSAVSEVTIINNGGELVTERGMSWSTDRVNIIYGPSTTVNATDIGTFICNLNNLQEGTLYYVRAYAKNSVGISYSSESSFVTSSVPTISTIKPFNYDMASHIDGSPESYNGTNAMTGGDITSNGVSAITKRGVVWSTSPQPTIALATKTAQNISGDGKGLYNNYLNALTPGTKYYVRAYATNSKGTGYGEELSFTTPQLATLITNPAILIKSTTLSSGGNITDDGRMPVLSRGLVWSTEENPDLDGTFTKDGKGSGIFVSDLKDLMGSTKYYLRAYATNYVGTSYGAAQIVTTAPPEKPNVITSSVEGGDGTTAKGGGTIKDNGGAEVTSHGVIWSLISGFTPDLSVGNKTSQTEKLNKFTSTLDQLLPNKTYYVRAYAVNSAGAGYGEEVSFKTFTLASLITTPATNLTSITATSGGDIFSDGGDKVTKSGIVWNTTGNPTIDLTTRTQNGIGIGTFIDPIKDLMGSTTYYVKAYAINKAGVSYGNEISFTTTPPVSPILTTIEVTDITGSTAVSGGHVISNGGSLLSGAGVVWNTLSGFQPDTATTQKTVQNVKGDFVSILTGLTPGTTYYARAYAANSAGLTFGNQVVLRTATLATLTTLKPIAQTITSTSATSGGTILGNGGSYIQSNGICWSTNPEPTIADQFVVAGSGSGSFTADLKDLMGSTTYYVRAFATNFAGTAYGNQETLETKPAVKATLTTRAITGISGTAAISGGNISSEGGALVTTRGIIWSLNPDFDPAAELTNRTAETGYGKGLFTSNLTNLSIGKTYYVCAYAVSKAGTAYGNILSFVTTRKATIVTTLPSLITHTAAVTGGTISDSGGSPVTGRGVFWSTVENFEPDERSLDKTEDRAGTGNFDSFLKDLKPSTQYYIRAYALTNTGMSYGQQVSLTTNPATVPVLSTTAANQLTVTTASSGGNITDEGGMPSTTRGVIWSTQADFIPESILLDRTTQTGSGKGIYTSNITNLTPGIQYYVRAYARNGVGYGYGNLESFVTKPSIAATVTTSAVSQITGTTAVGGGNIISNGNTTLKTMGIVWSVYPDFNPDTISKNKITMAGQDKGVFAVSMTNLKPGITYYVRAYAINSAETSYGDVTSFTTIGLPVIVTNSPGLITNTTGLMGGTVTSASGGIISSRGVYWSTVENFEPNPLSPDKTINGGGTGSFDSQLKDLMADTRYYVKAYATNVAGTDYGQQVGFTTYPPGLPLLTTVNPVLITGTTVYCGGNITEEGGVPTTIRGVVWSTTPNFNPETETVHRTLEGGAGKGIFNSQVTGLQPGAKYYIRAYATNRVGVGYGNELSFTTQNYATLTTTEISENAKGSAMSGGVISSDGGSKVTVQGLCWSTSPNPTSELLSKTIDKGTGTFISQLKNLAPSTLYYVRAYATNGLGTAYGNEISFVSAAVPPTLTTTDPVITSGTTASSGGIITSAGGAAITSKGIVWSSKIDFDPKLETVNRTNDGSGQNTFISELKDLVRSTAYYVRAYAENSAGITYGNQLTVTIFPTSPILLTTKVTEITGTTATSGGKITSDGGATVTKRGICWSTQQNPTNTLLTKTVDALGGDGDFTGKMTGLLPNTIYYVRAYAVNGIGVAYGLEESFITLAPPTLTATSPINNIRATIATSGGEITDDGRTPILSRGIVWDRYSDPTISLATKTLDNLTKGIGTFTADLSGLTPNTTYYVRAYATNLVGITYGSQTQFKTNTVSLPTLTTTSIASIDGYSAKGIAEITDDGGMPVVTRGFVWGTTTLPTVASTGKIVNGIGGTGIFDNVFGGMIPGTTYYVRAFATNSEGTAYGNEIILASAAVVPNLSAVTISNIQLNSVAALASLSFNGGSAITDLGFIWNTEDVIPAAAVGNNLSIGAVGTSISGMPANLLPATKYYIWAYGKNAIGTGYSVKSTTFSTRDFAKVTTTPASAITKNSFTSGGTILGDGGSDITQKGVVWSEKNNPTIADLTKTNQGAGIANYGSTVSGLNFGTLYYFRAYVTNAIGTSYGNLDSLTTINIPTVTTTAATNILSTTVTAGGEVTKDGGAAVTARGLVLALTPEPTLASSLKTADGAGMGVFTSNPKSLAIATKYYYRAYATNSVGTAYGKQDSVTTAAVLPVVEQVKLSEITENTAKGTSAVTSDGGAPVTASGLVWNTTGTPTLEDHVIVSKDINTIIGVLEGLEEGPAYYVRAYATNNVGTAYSAVAVNFKICKPLTVIHKAGISGAPTDKKITYETVGSNISGDYKCWITRNLGADQQATAVNDATEASSGWYFQFNRLQGYQYDGTTRTPSQIVAPWVSSNSEPTGWLAANDPCTQLLGNGWRIPTISEWTAVIGAPQNWKTNADAYNSILKLHNAGDLTTIGGLSVRGANSNYWSSTVYGNITQAYFYYNTRINYNDKGVALPVRCLQDGGMTSVPSLSNVEIPSATITANTAEALAAVINSGSSPVTSRGLVWNTTGNPGMGDQVISAGTGLGEMAGTLRGLDEKAVYYVRAFATNSVGTAFSPAVATFKVCLPITIIHTAGLNGAPVDKTVTYKTISSTVSGEARCWITQNLGADQQAKSATDGTEASAGWYFQFNRTQGYKHDGTVRTPNDPLTPWVGNIDEAGQWLAANDPCFRMMGGGWRMPTGTEWKNAIATQYWRSSADTYNSVLKIHAAGAIVTDALGARGTDSRYWSSSAVSSGAGNILANGTASVANKGTALPVRCLRNEVIATLPSVSNVILPLADMTETTANGSATINPDGNAAVTSRGFVWNTTGNPTLSDQVVPMGTGTGKISGLISGLENGPTYYVKAFATNSVGTAYSETTTSFKICMPFTVIHRAGLNGSAVDKTIIYGSVSTKISGTDKCWITRNLGADQQATAVNDATTASSGWYWQFNRLQGYQHDGTTRTPGAVMAPWVTSISESSSWLAVNDPCTQMLGNGWRIPTSTEWLSISATPQNWKTNTDVYNSFLKLHNAGDLANNGALNIRGANSNYWSSTGYGNISQGYFYNNTRINYNDKAVGLPLRCLQDEVVKRLPSVTSVVVPAESITIAAAVANATVTNSGGATITSRGLVWNTTGNPGMSDQVIVLGTGIGDITSSLKDLNEKSVYYVRAFATNSVGTSLSATVTSFKVCLPFTITHTAGLNGVPVDKTVTYKTVSTAYSGEARCWIAQNLGADQQAAAVNDGAEESAGWYFQYNRLQGYKHDGTTRTPNDPLVPWITSIIEAPQWLAANDPCVRMLGGGWRLPTAAEWTKAIAPPQYWRSNDDIYASLLKLHTAGYLVNTAGLTSKGTDARYWSSTSAANGTATAFYGWRLLESDKASALPVRCLRNEVASTIPSVSNVVLPLSEVTATTAKASAIINPDGRETVTARGFVWNTTGNPTLADQVVPMGNGIGTISGLISGLENGPTYYVKAFATNSVGTAYSEIATSFKVCMPFTVIHKAGIKGSAVDKTVTYGLVSTKISGVDKCWITQNLGADQQATDLKDATEASSGWYWQFNRLQGYQHDGTTRKPASVWLSSISESSGWVVANDPCTQLLGMGWRVPTSTEWISAIATPQNWKVAADAYASVLKLHAAGDLAATGALNIRGVNSNYWSSTGYGNISQGYYFNNVRVTYNDKAVGLPLRCLKD